VIALENWWTHTMTRPAYYFKLNRQIKMTQGIGSQKDSYFFVSGHVMKRRHPYLPAFTDEEAMYLSETYVVAEQYKDTLLKLESEAFKICENLCAAEAQLAGMIELHESNLKKLNLGYMLISWFRGMGGSNEST
jgi:hypothetical protein